jgi:hypothetical protein
MTKRKKSNEELKIKYINTGINYQRGMNLAVNCFTKGLPIILTDRDMDDLKTTRKVLIERGLLDKNLYFGGHEVLIGSYIEDLLRVYSNPHTIRNGLGVLEKMGANIFGSDLNDSPFAKQITQIKYSRRSKK